ncbi:MAG: hypothetical protein IT174_16680 [Acidobacteria bacterium]|nr:hypothetical protein [Acidobacteriota bacterium]
MRSLLFLAFSILLLIPHISAQTNLTVTNGSKNIGKARDRKAFVWANPSASNMVFDRWVGNTALVEDVYSASTLVNPLSKNIDLTATYKAAPSWSLTEETIGGVDVLYYIPQNPVAVIFRLHGTGGSAQSTLSSVESRLFSNDAVAAGYGIIALDSVDRGNGEWSLAPPPNNPDISNIQAIIANLQQRGLLSANTPLVAQGTSRGGIFSSLVVYYLNFQADAIYIAYGANLIMPQTTVPTIFCLAANDDQAMVGDAGNQNAYNQVLNLQGRGIMASYNLHPSSPVYPERFWRIANLTVDDSHAIYNALRANGFLDSRDFLIQNPRGSNWQSVIPPQYQPYLTGISSVLGAAYASHNFYSDHNARVLRFFSDALAASKQKLRFR